MAARSRFFDRAFGRYAATSALATVTDFIVANSLHTLGSTAATATFVGCGAGGVVAFALSRRWTFRAETGRAWPQLLRFLLVWATSAALNSAGVPALLHVVASFPLAWSLVRGAVYLGWNYPLSRWFVFAAPRGPSSAEATAALSQR